MQQHRNQTSDGGKAECCCYARVARSVDALYLWLCKMVFVTFYIYFSFRLFVLFSGAHYLILCNTYNQRAKEFRGRPRRALLINFSTLYIPIGSVVDEIAVSRPRLGRTNKFFSDQCNKSKHTD